MQGLKIEYEDLMDHKLINACMACITVPSEFKEFSLENTKERVRMVFEDKTIENTEKLAVIKQLHNFVYDLSDLIYPNYETRQIDGVVLWLFRRYNGLFKLCVLLALITHARDNTEKDISSVKVSLIRIPTVLDFYQNTLFKIILSMHSIECAKIEKTRPTYARIICNKKRKIDEENKDK